MLEFSSKENYVLLVHYFLIAIVGPINLKRGGNYGNGLGLFKRGEDGRADTFCDKINQDYLNICF